MSYFLRNIYFLTLLQLIGVAYVNASTFNLSENRAFKKVESTGGIAFFDENFEFPTTEGTVEFWVKIDMHTSIGHSIFTLGDIFIDGFLITMETHRPEIGIDHGNLYGFANNRIETDLKPAEGVWTHVALTWGSAGLKLYFDGSIVASNTISTKSNLPFSNNGLFFLNGFRGSINIAGDELRIWNVKRTAQEINDNKNKQLTGFEKNLLLYWNFNEEIDITNQLPVPDEVFIQGEFFDVTLKNIPALFSPTVEGILTFQFVDPPPNFVLPSVKSAHYPDRWTPNFKDNEGRFLHDFSYTGYQGVQTDIDKREIPSEKKSFGTSSHDNPNPETDPSSSNYCQPFYSLSGPADWGVINVVNDCGVLKDDGNPATTEDADVTSGIQMALDNAKQAMLNDPNKSGVIVYLPIGTYNIKPPTTPTEKNYSLLISGSKVVMRGDGPQATFLHNTEENMRFKQVIRMAPTGSEVNWQSSITSGSEKAITRDLLEPTIKIPVQSTGGYADDEWVVLRTEFTKQFIADHAMTDEWVDDENTTVTKLFGIRMYRQMKAVGPNKILTIDIPTRYHMLKDPEGYNAKVYKLNQMHIEEVGVEDLAIGMTENKKPGMEDLTNQDEVTGGGCDDGPCEVHRAHAIVVNHVVNGWIKNVHSYQPPENIIDVSSAEGDYQIHLLSNAVQLNYCRNISIENCIFQNPQYRGSGGNGYMYTFEGNDCLIRNSVGVNGRHNFSFKGMQTSGNVIFHCLAKNGNLQSDFHQHLSVANLIDNLGLDKDSYSAIYRPFETPIHAHVTSQSVFWNLYGINLQTLKGEGLTGIVQSLQFDNGYIIGTRGPFSKVLDFVPWPFNTSTEPLDFQERIGGGDDLDPVSLYEDQLQRRINP